MMNCRTLAKEHESDGGSDSMLDSSYRNSACELNPNDHQKNRHSALSKQRSSCKPTRKIMPVTIARPEVCTRHKLTPDQTICLVTRNGHRIQQQQLQHEKQHTLRRKRGQPDAGEADQILPRNRPVVILKDVSPSSKRKDINIVLHKNRNVTISNQNPCASKDAAVNTLPVNVSCIEDGNLDVLSDCTQIMCQLKEFMTEQQQQQLQSNNESPEKLPKQLAEQLQSLSQLALQTQAEVQQLARQTQEQLSQIARAASKCTSLETADKSSEIETESEMRTPSLSRHSSPARSQLSIASVLHMLMPIIDIVGSIATDEARNKKQQESPPIKSRVSFEPIDDNNYHFHEPEDQIEEEEESNWTDICTSEAKESDSDQTLMPPKIAAKDSRLRLRSSDRLQSGRSIPTTEQLKHECELIVQQSLRDIAQNRSVECHSSDFLTNKQQVCIDIIKNAVEKMKQTVGPSNGELMHSALQQVFGKEIASDSEGDETITDPFYNRFRPTVKSDNLIRNSFSDARSKLLAMRNKEDPAAAVMCKMVHNLNQALKDISDQQVDQDALKNTLNGSRTDDELKPKLGHTLIPGLQAKNTDLVKDTIKLNQEQRCRRNLERTNDL